MLSNIQIWLALLRLLLLQKSFALKCRSEDGPSDAELKRITRSCMRKVSENVNLFGNDGNMGGYNTGLNTNYHYNSNGYHNNNNNNNNPQSHNNNNNNYGRQNHYRSEYDDSDEISDISDGDNYNYERHGNGRNNNGNNNDNNYQHRNRERNTMLSNRNSGANGNGNGNSGSGGQRLNNGANNNNNNDGNTSNQRNTNSKAYNNNNSNKNNNNNNNGHSGSSAIGNARNMGSSGNDNNRNNGTTYDSGCVVHCFFDEMNMLNRDGYPDRHKVNYMLTKDIRDRELRNFYVDTIQSCFRYLESQRRHDRCHFARELIQCMTEYAKANCDDWQEYNVMFN